MHRTLIPLLFVLAHCYTEKIPKESKTLEAPPASKVSEAPKITLSYIERVKGDPATPLPMLVAVHGLGDTPEGFARVFDDYDGPLRIILLQGITPFHGGFSWFDLSDGLDIEKATQGVAYAAAQIEAALEDLPKKFPTVGKPVLTGFSQGGMLSFTVAAQRPDLIQAAIPLAGFLPPGLLPTEPPKVMAPIYALHGNDDARIGIDLSSRSVRSLLVLGYLASLEPFAGVGHALPPVVRQALYAKLRFITQPPPKSCSLSSDCDAELLLRCASGKGVVDCPRPTLKTGEQLLGLCRVVCQ
jgi:phospholipase/carboxylesterase